MLISSGPPHVAEIKAKLKKNWKSLPTFLKRLTFLSHTQSIYNFLIPPLLVTPQILLLKTPLFHQCSIFGFKPTSKHKQNDWDSTSTK